jgi:capsular exopolysaccharide synthesis family protein
MFNLMVVFYQKLNDLTSELQLLEKLSLEENLERERQLAIASMLGPAQQQGVSLSAGISASELELIKVKQYMLMLKARQQELGASLRPKHPQMIELSEEIVRQENLLGVYRQQSKEDLENKKRSLQLQIQDLNRSIKEWENKSLIASRQKTDYERLKTDFQRVQSLYDKMLESMELVSVGRETTQESVTIMEEATDPEPDRLGRVKGLLLAGFLGLSAGVAFVFFLERLDDRPMSFLELQELFDEEILAQIPREKKRRKESRLALIQSEDSRHSFVEAFRSLRSSLMFVPSPAPKIILLTSSIPNDGKSLVTANLAVTMANAGSRVLLIDADLRKGAQHRTFDIEAEPGLAEVLAKSLDPATTIKPTAIANLYLLPRGAITPNSSELFLRESIDEFLKGIASQYDYILLDSPPVMAADDVSCLAPHADGVLFLIRAEHTSARVARAALDALYQRKVRVLGLVFNSVRASSGEYYYYGYKDYYAKYPSA